METIRNVYGHTHDQVFEITKRCYYLKDTINLLVNSIEKLDIQINSYRNFIDKLNKVSKNINASVENILDGYNSFINGGYNSNGQDISEGKLKKISNELNEQKELTVKIIGLANEKLKDKIFQRNNKLALYKENNTAKINIINNWQEPEVRTILNSILVYNPDSVMFRGIPNFFSDDYAYGKFRY